MIIERLSLYEVAVPLKQTLVYSNERTMVAHRAIVVRINTPDGITGWGEACPGGRTYGAAFSEGARAALEVIGPELVGKRCDQLFTIQAIMDSVLSGHVYAKSPVVQACVDIIGKSSGLPAHTLLGGKVSETSSYPGFIMTMASEETKARIAELRSQGFTHFIPHGSGQVERDLEIARLVHDALEGGETMTIDANGGYSRLDAIRFITALPKSSKIVVEQPCASYEDCAAVKKATGVPMVLDECMTGLEPMMRAWADGVLDGLKLKIDRVGGILKAQQLRDAAATLGIPVWVQASAGTEISEAAIAHLSASTPRSVFAGAASVTELNKHPIGRSAVRREGACLVVSDTPGFGADPDGSRLGEPIAVFT